MKNLPILLICVLACAVAVWLLLVEFDAPEQTKDDTAQTPLKAPPTPAPHHPAPAPAADPRTLSGFGVVEDIARYALSQYTPQAFQKGAPPGTLNLSLRQLLDRYGPPPGVVLDGDGLSPMKLRFGCVLFCDQVADVFERVSLQGLPCQGAPEICAERRLAQQREFLHLSGAFMKQAGECARNAAQSEDCRFTLQWVEQTFAGSDMRDSLRTASDLLKDLSGRITSRAPKEQG